MTCWYGDNNVTVMMHYSITQHFAMRVSGRRKAPLMFLLNTFQPFSRIYYFTKTHTQKDQKPLHSLLDHSDTNLKHCMTMLHSTFCAFVFINKNVFYQLSSFSWSSWLMLQWTGFTTDNANNPPGVDDTQTLKMSRYIFNASEQKFQLYFSQSLAGRNHRK